MFNPAHRILLCIDADDTTLNTRAQFVDAALEENQNVDLQDAWHWPELALPKHVLSQQRQSAMLASAEFMPHTKALPGAYLALTILCEQYDVAIVTHRGYHPDGQAHTYQCLRNNFGPLVERGKLKVYALPTSVDKHAFCRSLCLPTDSTGIPAYDGYKLIDDNIPWDKYGTSAIYGTLYTGEELRKYIARHSIVLDQPWNQGSGFEGFQRVNSLVHLADVLCSGKQPLSTLAQRELDRLLHPNVPAETHLFGQVVRNAAKRSRENGNAMLAIPSSGPGLTGRLLARVPNPASEYMAPATQWRSEA